MLYWKEVGNIFDITSLQNPNIKNAKALKLAKHRKKQHKFLVEGIRLVKEAMDCNALLETIFFCPNKLRSAIGLELVKIAEAKEINCISTPLRVFKSMSERDNPQGIIAVVHQLEPSLENISLDKHTLIVVAHELQEPGNLGTIIRTADSAGASGIVVTGTSVDLFDPKAVRATMGSIFSIPVVRMKEINEFKRWAFQKNIKLIATSPNADRYYFDLEYKEPVAILLGNEARGLNASALDGTHKVVKIPMIGKADSLNVASAAAILIYEVVRQRLGNQKVSKLE